MRRSAVAAMMVASLVAMGAAPAWSQSTPTAGWHVPRCSQVDSDGTLTYTRNEGNYLAATTGTLQPVMADAALATLATPNDLLAVDIRGKVSTSHDAGCSWTAIGTVQGQTPIRISAAPDGSAYVWSRLNDQRLYRVVGGAITELPLLPTDTFGGMAALTVDPADPAHLRAVTASGSVLDSRDGGQTFQQRGTTPDPGAYPEIDGYDATIAAGDLDHIVLGTSGEGIFTTTDGGTSWSRASVGAPRHRVNGFTVLFAPADDTVVWAMILDITEMDSGAPSEGRHIVRSTDGGRTFTAVVDHVPGVVTLTNGPLLAADPADPAVVYFVFGTWFGNYGTDLFRYDATRAKLTSTHNDHDGIRAIAFNPGLPSVMYLGLAEER